MNSKWNSRGHFNRHGCPCTADCEKRCVGCRSTCEAFQAYETNRIECDKKRRYNIYDSLDNAHTTSKPFTASTFRSFSVNDRIRRQKARGYLV